MKNIAYDNFLKSICRYLNYINVLNEMETESIVSSIIIRSSDMIKQVVRHCQDWISNYSQALLNETVALIEGFYEYIDNNGKR